jgi:hypothetical protein
MLNADTVRPGNRFRRATISAPCQGGLVIGQSSTSRLNPNDDVDPVQVFEGQGPTKFKLAKNLAHPVVGSGHCPMCQGTQMPDEGGTDHFPAECLDHFAQNNHVFATLVKGRDIVPRLRAGRRAQGKRRRAVAAGASDMPCAGLKHM